MVNHVRFKTPYGFSKLIADDVELMEVKRPGLPCLGQSLQLTFGEIVDGQHFPIIGNQAIGQVRAYEPCPTSDQCFAAHDRS